MNSWQSPVTGEPSWGTLHTCISTLVNAVNPGSTSTMTVLVSNVPMGTKGIMGYANIAGATTGRVMNIKDADTNVWAVIRETYGAANDCGFIVPLDSEKRFHYNVDNADVSSISIYLRGYFS